MKKLLFKVVGLLSNKTSKTDFSRLEGLEMVNYGNKYRFNRLKKAMLLLPDNVLAELIKEEITIIYSKNATPVQDGKFAGWYNYEKKMIYIWDNGSGSLYWQITTILHEVGHFVDFQLARGEQFRSCIDKDFHEVCHGEKQYYNKFSMSTGENYYTGNIKEYFAQSFAEYFLIPGFKNKCPQTKEYIEQSMKIL